MQPFVIGHCDGASTMLDILKPALRLVIPSDRPILYQADPRRCDLLIYSVFGQKHRQYPYCPKILMCGEPDDVSRATPDLLIDCKDVAKLRLGSTRFCYLPFYVTSFGERFRNQPSDLIKSSPFTGPVKSKFCAFLYSQNVDFRNRLFDFISGYKPVDALGKARAPVQKPHDRQVYRPGQVTYNDLAVEKYRGYKFVICCENSRHPGYVTEKMISAMLAGAIPIYYGAPDVIQHFNEQSFIHVTSEQDWPRALAEIRRLDQDEKAYQEKLQVPWLPNNQLPVYFQPEYLAAALNVTSWLETSETVAPPLQQQPRRPVRRLHPQSRDPARLPLPLRRRPLVQSGARPLPPRRRPP